MENRLHTGELIKNFIEKSSFTRTTLAHYLNINSTAIYGFEKRTYLHCQTLMRICNATKHNFFMDIANTLPESFSHNPGPISDGIKKQLEDTIAENQSLIAQQAAEIARLKTENELLKELFKMKN